MTNTETTRRGLIGAAGIAAVALAAPVNAISPRALGIRPEYQAAYDAIGVARAACSRFAPTFAAAKARCEAVEAQVPHVTFRTSDDFAPEALTYSTGNTAHVRSCRRLVQQWREARDQRKRRIFTRDVRRLVAAATWRDRALARIRRDSGMDAAWERDELLGDAWATAEDDFLNLRAATAQELALKVQAMNEGGVWQDDRAADWIGRDVFAIAGREVVA